MSAARHSNDSPEWYTPTEIIVAAATVMGGIDLDPASHMEAKRRLWIRRIFTARSNGLKRPWRGRVFLNPPSGLVLEFWQKLLAEFHAGRVTQAVWIGYSIEQLQTLQSCEDFTPLDYPMCVPRRRIPFVENAAKRRARIRKLRAAGKTPNLRSQPSHANYITYLGSRTRSFERVFAQFGRVRA